MRPKPRLDEFRDVLKSIDLFRMYPDSDIAKQLNVKHCSACHLRHNRKPKRIKRS